MYHLFNLEGKRAVITGGTGDLGRAIGEGFLEAGAEVVLIGTTEKAKEIARDQNCKGYKAHGLIGRLDTAEEREQLFSDAIELLGGDIDILVNSAGVQYIHDAVDYPPDAFNRILNINVTALFHMCQMAGKRMIEQRHGKIINLASAASFFGAVRMPAYSSSKGAVAQLTKELGNEWGPYGVNVNALAPGHMATKINTAVVDDPIRSAEILKRIPLQRFGKPEELKGPAIFLASSASDYMRGVILPVDGGYLVR